MGFYCWFGQRGRQGMRVLCGRARIVALAASYFALLLPGVLAQNEPASVPDIISALQAGRTEEALRMCSDVLRSDPRSFKVWTLKALALDQSGRSKDALSAYQHSLSLAPDYLPALEGAAQLNYKANSDAAIPQLRKIISLQPANPTAHAMLGVLEYGKAEYEPAAQDFEAAEQVLSNQPAAFMDYSICLARLNRIPESIAHFQQLLALRPSDAAARYDLALVQWHSQASADALATLQPLLDAQPTDSNALRLAAAIHEGNNETPQAVDLLREAITANPDEAANYVEFATLSFTHGSYSVGIDIVNLGIKRLPNSSALYMARGVLYAQNGDSEKAMTDFEHAHKLDPSYSMAATAEGISQSQRHDHEAALRDFRRQVSEHPNDAYGHYLLAEALSWSPPNTEPGGNQQSVLQAISAAKIAVHLNPQLAQAYDLLGSLYLQTGQVELAIKACRSALAINPKDQQAIYSLILSLRKTGQKSELDGLVKQLTDLRRQEGEENARKYRYGQLIEGAK